MIRTRLNGFTLVELIAVMVIIGILAVAVLPRFLDPQTFRARGFYDQALAMVRYAQKVAIAQRTNVFVNVNAATNTLCLTYVADLTCTNPAGVRNPANQAQANYRAVAPAGVTFSSSVSFSFSALGKPGPDAAATLTISGDGMTRTVRVERETGYVH